MDAHLVFCCAVENAIVALSGARVVRSRESEVGEVERAEVGVAVASCRGTIAPIHFLAAAGECSLVVVVQLYTDPGDSETICLIPGAGFVRITELICGLVE